MAECDSTDISVPGCTLQQDNSRTTSDVNTPKARFVGTLVSKTTARSQSKVCKESLSSCSSTNVPRHPGSGISGTSNIAPLQLEKRIFPGNLETTTPVRQRNEGVADTPNTCNNGEDNNQELTICKI